MGITKYASVGAESIQGKMTKKERLAAQSAAAPKKAKKKAKAKE